MKTKITEMEKQVLSDIVNSEFSSDGYGLMCGIDQMFFSLPIKQVRALLSTLAQKKIVHLAKPDRYDPNGFVTVANEYQADNKLVNVEVK